MKAMRLVFLLSMFGMLPTLEQPETLLLAAREGDADRVAALVSAGVDVNATDPDGRTALMFAAGRADIIMVELLLENGADAGLRDREGVSALTIAKAEQTFEIVSLLREAGAQESAEELLDEAVRAGDVDAVDALIARGVDIDALDTASYRTPLMTALELRELEVFLRLVRAGADPTREGTGIETTGENAISVSARQRSPWALRVLVESRARQHDLDRALHLACDSAAVVGVLLEAGARVEARNLDDETPLMCAAAAGALESVEALLEAGASATAEGKNGRTAADLAEQNGHRDVAARLTR